jgi:hypothetical protein
MFIKTKLVLQAQSWCVPGRPLLAPLYRWPGPEVLVRSYTNSPCYGGLHVVSLFEYSIYRLLSWTYILMGLNPNISQGYQRHGPWRAYPCHSLSSSISLPLNIVSFTRIVPQFKTTPYWSEGEIGYNIGMLHLFCMFIPPTFIFLSLCSVFLETSVSVCGW